MKTEKSAIQLMVFYTVLPKSVLQVRSILLSVHALEFLFQVSVTVLCSVQDRLARSLAFKTYVLSRLEIAVQIVRNVLQDTAIQVVAVKKLL